MAEYGATVPAGGVANAPALPGADEYLPATLTWYTTWCTAPQASAFTVTDWQRLHMLAPLVDAYWQKPAKDLLSEIRLNESLLGATHVDRLRARIKVEAPKSSAPSAPSGQGGVTDMTKRRRERMTDAS